MMDKVFKVSWATWDGRKSEKITYDEFYEKYSYLTNSDGITASLLRKLTDKNNKGSSVTWNEEEGNVTITRIE